MSGVWKPARQKYGVAVCNFSGDTVKQALPLNIGDTVQVLEEYFPDTNTDNATWLRGCTFSNKSKKGIFPRCFIAFKNCTVENEGPFEIVTPVEDAVITELIFVLREWNTRWKMLFVERKQLFQTIYLVMGELAKYRSQLESNTLTREKALEQKHHAITMIDWGNSQLGLDLVPRVEYQQVDPDQLSIVEMFKIHEQSVKNCQGAWIVEEPGGVVTVNEKRNEKVFHLLITLCSLGCDIGDNAEVYLSLYDSHSSSSISERFVMYFNKTKHADADDKSLKTIFTDLVAEEMRKDIYLVVQIFRKGRLTLEGSFKKAAAFQYRRPWGVSVLGLKELFQIHTDADLEYFLRVHSADNENFYNMHETLIRRQAQMLGRSLQDKQNQGITLSVKLLHGDMKNVKIENPLLFNRPAVVLTQRMGFSEFINPGEVRNDLYLTLLAAELDRGSKTASKNIEARISVYNQNGEVIKDCILMASGDQMCSTYFSYVLYHSNTPKWCETVRLSIPIEKFNSSHVRIELCHCSNRDRAEKKMYGFAFLTLTVQGNIAREDGKYDLCIYKCDDPAKVKNYLRLPYMKEETADPKSPSTDHSPYQHSNREFVSVRTLLCSTKFAQKNELLNILQWRSKPSKIPYHLDSLIKLKGQELVRYLQDVLDALFDMFSAGEREQVPFAMEIFQTLVHIFNLLHEDMFEKFSDVLEDYLQKSFSSPLAHRDLMLCLKKQADRIYTCSEFDEKSARKVFKVMGDIFKFAVQSCIISKRINADQPVNEFKANLNMVFGTFGNVLKSSETVIRKAQAHILKHLHLCFVPLLHVESVFELAEIVKFLLSKVSQEPGNKVTRAKMCLIQHTINSPLMMDAAARGLLLPLCLNHIRKCLVHKKNLELTASTLGDLLSLIYKLKDTCNIKDEVTQVIQVVFEATVRILRKMEKDERLTAGKLLVACFTEMLRLMDVSHYQKLLGEYQKPDSKVRLSTIAINHASTPAMSKNFLNAVVLVFKDLVTTNDYPQDWITMRMVTNNVLLTSIQYIAEDLTVNFLRDQSFDKELWYNFFQLAVNFITQPELQLEKYSEAKSSLIKDKYNDMRVTFGCHIYSLWNQLGSNKQHLIMEMIGPFLKVTMVPQPELRKATIPIFFDILQCEFALKADLKRVEGKMIHELDSLVIEHNGDVEYKKMFSSILLDKVQTEPELQEEGKRFVFSVTDLLERLLDYRDIMDREEQRDTKMHCTFNILNFYKESRRDMYIRYILRLYELHFSANNFVEAGLTLKLYAQLLEWTDVKLAPEMSYPSATESERKELLYKRIIFCFDKGNAWEYGLPLCKELGEFYERSFQYSKLAEILQNQAAFYQRILEGNKLRQDPTFYRVAYYGNTFPPYLKNKAFIYRGDECLRLATIMNQLTTEYPSANILTSNSPLDESYKTGDAQFIQLVSVKPVPSERKEFVGKQVPIEIASFYNTNEVDTFQFDRPYHRDDKDKNNEFKSLCLERTIMKSSYPLPGILRWYEVVKTETIQFCPVQTASLTVQQMNEELKTSAENALNNPEQCISHLSMRLQGVISGAVNGGIPKYQEAFFNEVYQKKYPDEAEHIDRLKSDIQEQIHLLEKGLSIQAKYSSQEMLPLHNSLLDMFSKMKSSMGYQTLGSRQRGSNLSSISSASSLRPSTPSSASLNSNNSNRSSVVSTGDTNDDESYLDPVNEETINKHLCKPQEALLHLAKPPYFEKRRSHCNKSNLLYPPSSSSSNANKYICQPSLPVVFNEPLNKDSQAQIAPVIPRKMSLSGGSADSPKTINNTSTMLAKQIGVNSPSVMETKPLPPTPPKPVSPSYHDRNGTIGVPELPPRPAINTPASPAEPVSFKSPPPLPSRKPPPSLINRDFSSEMNLSSSGHSDSLYNNSNNFHSSLAAPTPPPSRSTNFLQSRNTRIVSAKDPPPALPSPQTRNTSVLLRGPIPVPQETTRHVSNDHLAPLRSPIPAPKEPTRLSSSDHPPPLPERRPSQTNSQL